jgi:hypothetical protein
VSDLLGTVPEAHGGAPNGQPVGKPLIESIDVSEVTFA